jgi:hypothetical protein
MPAEGLRFDRPDPRPGDEPRPSSIAVTNALGKEPAIDGPTGSEPTGSGLPIPAGSPCPLGAAFFAFAPSTPPRPRAAPMSATGG